MTRSQGQEESRKEDGEDDENGAGRGLTVRPIGLGAVKSWQEEAMEDRQTKVVEGRSKEAEENRLKESM